MPSDTNEKTRGSRHLGRIWVAGTTILIAFIAYSSQLFVILPVYEHAGDSVGSQLVFFNALVAMVFYCYYRVVFSDPGTVPKDYQPNMDDPASEVKRLTGRPRYCKTCQAYKPPRAHHCRQCKRCILKMDHHCPWVDNCLGYRNYADFIRFLCFVDVACAYHLYLISTITFGPAFFALDDPSPLYITFLILNYATCVPVLFTVSLFTIYHLWCLCTNTTTIESSEKDRAVTLIKRGRIRQVQYPYDLGILNNIKSVMGDLPAFWCWPHRPSGDGLSFPTSVHVRKWLDSGDRDDQDEDGEPIDDMTMTHYCSTDPNEQYSWPPEDMFEDDHVARPPISDADAFTYGSGLNPNLLTPTQRMQLMDDDDEDVPLSSYAHGLRTRRLRRGSEGFEVKPLSMFEREQEVHMQTWDDDDNVYPHVTRQGRYHTYETAVSASDSESESESEQQ